MTDATDLPDWGLVFPERYDSEERLQRALYWGPSNVYPPLIANGADGWFAGLGCDCGSRGMSSLCCSAAPAAASPGLPSTSPC